jgi:hypothetical protein
MTITKRVSGTISEDISKRVDYFDAVADSISDPWNGSWGNSWGNSWRIVTTGSAAEPAIDITERVGSTPSGGITKRVTGV